MTYLQFFLVVSLPLMGFVYALLGGLKLPLAARLKLDEARVGKLVAAFGLMVGPTIMACGFLTDAVGRKGVFLAGMTAVAAGIFVLARGTSYRSAVLAVLLLGAGWSAAVNVGNVLMRISVPAASQTQAMNFYDCIFGFGAFVSPFVLGLLLKRFDFSRGLVLLAGLMLVPVALGIGAPMNPDGPQAAGALADVGSLFTSKLFWIAGLAFLFYVPIESSVAGWATTLVTKQGPGGERTASLALSGFWMSFMGSRLLMSQLPVEKREKAILFGLALACIALMVLLVFLRGRLPVAVLVVGTGLVCGPVFPTLITVYLTGVDASLLGRAVGFFFAFASVGWTVLPALIGAVARRSGDLQRGFGVAAASAVAFAVFAVLLFRLR